MDLRPEGITPGGAVGSSERSQIEQLRVGAARSLAQLSDYCFYTPAFIYLTMRLPADPQVLYGTESGIELCPAEVVFDFAVFSGLNAPDGNRRWNHVLHGLPCDEFRAYSSWLGSVGVHDPGKGLFSRVRTQDLLLQDPLAVTHGRVHERVKVIAFVVETNKGSFCFEHGSELPVQARFDQTLRYQDTIAMTDRLATGSDSPYGENE